jgi:hypothetical protein
MGRFVFAGLVVMAVVLFKGAAFAQIPVEIFTGDKKATVDIMFFRFFKNSSGDNSKFLFFSRNRASIDYEMSGTENLPQFGFTEAISCNHPKLRGFAPVFVGQVFNAGIYPKAGLQYVHFTNQITIFSWFVTETLQNPRLDYYLLFRFVPKISEKTGCFTQVESLNTLPTSQSDGFLFSQRIRIGLKKQSFQFGLGTDLSETGRNSISLTTNTGLFLRYEF